MLLFLTLFYSLESIITSLIFALSFFLIKLGASCKPEAKIPYLHLREILMYNLHKLIHKELYTPP